MSLRTYLRRCLAWQCRSHAVLTVSLLAAVLPWPGAHTLEPEVAEVIVLGEASQDAMPVQSESATQGDNVDMAIAPVADTHYLPELLDLETAQAIALEDNPGIGIAISRVDQARERVRQAQARYLPSVDVTYSAAHIRLADSTVDAARGNALRSPINNYLRSTFNSFITSGGELRSPFLPGLVQNALQGMASRSQVRSSMDSYSTSLMVSYVLFDGFARKFNRLSAEYGVLEHDAALAETQRLLLDALAQTYYDAQLAQANIDIAEADQAYNERLLREAEIRRQVGTGSLSDVLNFEVQLRAAKSERLRAERTLEQARISLAALMGMESGHLPEAVQLLRLEPEHEMDMQLPDVETGIAYALDYRPDILLEQYGRKRSEALVGQRQAAYYPRVTAMASQDAHRSNNTRFNRNDFDTRVGLNISYELYAGGRRNAEVAEARQQTREYAHRLQDARIAATAEIRRAFQDLKTAQEELRLQRDTAAYVERNRELVESEYAVGQGSLTRLNLAQRDLIEAQGRLARAQAELRLSWYQFRTSTGETLREREFSEEQEAKAAAQSD